jgi:hypothetical protein
MQHPVNNLGYVLVSAREVIYLLADERRVIAATVLERFEQFWRCGKSKHALKVPSAEIRNWDAGRLSSASST